MQRNAKPVATGHIHNSKIPSPACKVNLMGMEASRHWIRSCTSVSFGGLGVQARRAMAGLFRREPPPRSCRGVVLPYTAHKPDGVCAARCGWLLHGSCLVEADPHQSDRQTVPTNGHPSDRLGWLVVVQCRLVPPFHAGAGDVSSRKRRERHFKAVTLRTLCSSSLITCRPRVFLAVRHEPNRTPFLAAQAQL